MAQAEVMVTICCICYNHEKTLRRALDSFVAQQTDFPYEILIHDDASTDGSQKIIREYQQRYPDLIRVQLETENQYSKSRFFVGKLLASTRAKYVACCETDDYWTDPFKLQMQVDALEAHPECVFSVHNTQEVDSVGRPLGSKFPPIKLSEGRMSSEEYIRHELFEGKWMFQLSSFLFRHDVLVKYAEIEAVGFPSKYYKTGDQPLFLFFATEGDAWYIDRDMSCYRVNSGGFMTRLKTDKAFCQKVQLGYVSGLRAFEDYSKGRFAESTHRAILRREFLYDLTTKDYKSLTGGKYSELRDELGSWRRMRYRLMGLLPSNHMRGGSARGGLGEGEPQP